MNTLFISLIRGPVRCYNWFKGKLSFTRYSQTTDAEIYKLIFKFQICKKLLNIHQVVIHWIPWM